MLGWRVFEMKSIGHCTTTDCKKFMELVARDIVQNNSCFECGHDLFYIMKLEIDNTQ